MSPRPAPRCRASPTRVRSLRPTSRPRPPSEAAAPPPRARRCGGRRAAVSLAVALAGAGFFAREHAAGWAACPAARLVAAADPDLAKAEALAPGHAFADAGAMLEATRPDLLDIAAPPPAHAGLIRLGLAAGVRSIVCQKPFCTSLAEAAAVTAQAEAAGARLIVHENFRWMPWWRAMKTAIDERLIGEPLDVTFRLRPGDGQGPDAYLARQPYFREMPRFLLRETGVHLIDVFRFLLGAPEAVQADLRRLNPAIRGEDAGHLRLRFASGARATLDANRLLDHAAPDPRRTMGEGIAEGTAGVLAFGGDGVLRRRRFGNREGEPVAAPPAGPGFGGGCVAAFQTAAAEAIAGDAPFGTEARAYLEVLALEAAAYDSDAAGGAWTPPAPLPATMPS